MVYEIFTHGGGEYVIEVLNAIVRIMGANSFVTAMRLSVTFGLVAVFCDIAMNGNFTKTIKYYFSFFLIYSVFFVPKVDVIVTDPITTIRTDRKVDNVPFGLAFNAHVISSLGNWLTNTFEMNFALPDDLQYNKTGLLFGNTVLEQTLSARIHDSRVRHNFHNFIKQCITPSIYLKRVSFEEVLKSEDIAILLGYGSNGVLAFEFTNKSNQTVNKLCKDTNDLKTELGLEVSKIISSQENKNDGKASNGALTYILGIQESTSKLFEQTLMMNAIEDSTQEYLAMVGADAGATNYAMTKDDLQRKQTGILQWLQANKYLPLLKITIEVMFYALFPIVILVAMLPNGFKPFKAYIMILFALQMWAPLYAILNLIMTLQQKYRINLLMDETGNIISLYNRQAILNISQGIMTQAGVLAWSIPVLSYKIIAGMQGFAEGLSGVAHSGAFTANQVASEVASGNLSYGNGSFKNTSWGNENCNNTQGNKHDTNEVYSKGLRTTQSGDGVAMIETMDGRIVYGDSARNSNITSQLRSDESKNVSLQKQLNQAQNTAQAKQFSISETVNELNDWFKSYGSSNSENKGVSLSDGIKFSGGVGFTFAGNGATLSRETAIQQVVGSNASKQEQEQAMSKIDKMFNEQKQLNDTNTKISGIQDNINYVTTSNVHTMRQRNDDFHNHLRKDKGYSEEQVQELIKNPEIYQKIGQDWLYDTSFDKNVKPEMYGHIKQAQNIFTGDYNNKNMGIIHDIKKGQATGDLARSKMPYEEINTTNGFIDVAKNFNVDNNN